MDFKVTLVFKYLPAPIHGLDLLDRVRKSFKDIDVQPRMVNAGIKREEFQHDPDKDIYIHRVSITEDQARRSGHFKFTDEIYLDISENRILEFLDEEYEKKEEQILVYYQLNEDKFLKWWEDNQFPTRLATNGVH